MEGELTPRQKLINILSFMADFETEDAEAYLRREGLDPEQLKAIDYEQLWTCN
jgi:hypothetical protein